MKTHDENPGFKNHIFGGEKSEENEDATYNMQLDEQEITKDTQDEAEFLGCEIESAGDITFNKSDLLSLSIDEELGQDFANFLDALDHDSTSLNHGLDDGTSFNRDSSKKSFNSLWENSYELKAPTSVRNQSIAPDVLQKLLESDTKNDTELEKDKKEGSNELRSGLGCLLYTSRCV